MWHNNGYGQNTISCFDLGLDIMGYEGAVEYWRAHRETFDMVLITEGGEICVTEGISGGFRSEEEYTVLKAESGSYSCRIPEISESIIME